MARHLRRFARQLCAARYLKSNSRRRSRLTVQTLEDRTTPSTIVVTSAADSGPGTLRDAIDQANGLAGADTIQFDATGLFATPQTISLQTALPTITDTLTITGTGAANLTVQRDLAAANFRVLDSTAHDLTLSGFTVTNGVADTDIGGGLRSSGNVNLDHMVFTGNQATGTTGFDQGGGGAIGISVGSGLLKVVESTITGNTAAKNGGGIFFRYSVYGSLLVQDSTITGNSQTFTGTSAGFFGGGGIFLAGIPSSSPPPGFTPGAFSVTNSTIASNSATGSGGGIFANGVFGGILVQDSTVSGNTALKAGKYVYGTSTYYYGGGGIGTVFGVPTVSVRNSVVSGNINAGGDPDIQTTNPVNLYNSAVGDPTGFTLSGASSGNLAFGTNLLLGPLADNGGPTRSMAPQPGSPLIDAGSNALVPSGITNDQRGFGYRRTFNGTVDIGAVEVQPLGLPFALSDPTPLTAPGGSTYRFTVTYWDPTGTNNGIQFGTVNNNSAAIVVKDPGGNVIPVTAVNVAPQSDASPLVATYQIAAPGGTWDQTDDTIYTLQVGTNQVKDRDNNFVPADLLGSIDIFIPRTLVVTNDNDSGPGSLRDALDTATFGAEDTIAFDPTFFNVPRTISLLTPLPFEGPDSGALTIQGPGTDLLTVQRDPAAATDFRVIYSAAPNLTLSEFTITGGTGIAAGAATFGSTTLDHMALTGNTSNDFAGGLYIGNNQDVTVVDSLISGNTAATDVGGILVSAGAHLVLDHSIISGNTATAGVAGGVLVNTNATLDVIDSTISGNMAGTAGGGVFLSFGATLNLINSTLSGNTASSGPGGGVYDYYASINVSNSTISGNSATTNGGGLYFFNGGSLTVESSTISGNQTTASTDLQGGGGIYFFGTPNGEVDIENSTIANNTSAGSGGGILLRRFNGLIFLFNSTVSGNTAFSTTAGYGGGGVADLDGLSTIGVIDSVVSGNMSGSAPDVLSTGQVYAYSSLIFSPNGFTLTGGSGNIPFGTDPMLGPLQDNGGPTETMAPLAGSPLLDTGDNTLIQPGITTDQRGLDRVDPETGLVDIGAVEAQAATVTIAPAVGQANPTNDNTAVNFTVVFDQPVTGFDASGIDLTGSTATGNLVVNVTPVNSTVYTVTITGITGDGDVVASVLAGTATVGINASGQPNLPSDTPATVTVDTTAPTVTVNQDAAQADPTNAGPITFDIQFDEPVTGFDQTMLTLGGTLAADASIVTFFPGAAPNSWVVVVGVTGTDLTGTVTVSVPTGVTTDLAGNPNTASGGDNSVTFDNAPPTVTINQASTQGDPGGGLSVSFDVVFSEPVVGFNGSKVDLSASTAPGTLVATVTGAGPVYSVTVTGMTGGGTVVASIDPGVVTDLAGNLNLGSTSTDNSVTYIHSGIIHLSAASYSISEAGAPQLTITVQRTDGSDGALDIHYSTADGTAVAGTDYTAASGNLHWDAGDTADKTFTVQILDDGGLEPDAAFTVNLSNISLSGALGTPATATVNINEEAALGFTSSTYNTAESGTGTDVVKQITVSRQFGRHGAVSVDYTVTGVTATAGADYSALASGTLTWADGDTADKTINVTIHDDTFSEGKETINLVLSNPTGGAVLGTSAATLIIDPSDGVTIQATAKSPQVTLPADADGNIVSIRLGGKVGSFTYYLTNDAVPVSEIDLNGTVSTKSALSITVKKARGFSGTPTATIGAIDGTGIDGTGTAGLKTLSLGKVNLVGDGIAGDGITFNGYVGSVVVGDVLNGADILLSGTATTPRGVPLATRITAGQIEGSTATGLTDITVAAPLASLRAIRIGQGTITAPSVGAIAVTGKAKTRTAAAILGDLESDITVAGTGLASTKAPALRSLRVAGTVRGSTITVGGGAGTDGNVGTVSVGAFVDSVLFAGYAGPADGSGTFNLPATVGSFVVRPPTKAAPNNEFAGSHVIAANFNTVSVGAVDPNVTGVKFGFIYHTALKALTVKTPKFKFIPKGPAVQDLPGTDFEVKKV